MEQTLKQRNSPGNVNGTNSLKALANKVLERNKERNTNGIRYLKPVPLRGTNFETNCASQYDDLSYGFEERAAIVEIDGKQNPLQTHRIAYLDSFISILWALTEDAPHQDWLAQKIQTALAALEAKTFQTLN